MVVLSHTALSQRLANFLKTADSKYFRFCGSRGHLRISHRYLYRKREKLISIKFLLMKFKISTKYFIFIYFEIQNNSVSFFFFANTGELRRM